MAEKAETVNDVLFSDGCAAQTTFRDTASLGAAESGKMNVEHGGHLTKGRRRVQVFI